MAKTLILAAVALSFGLLAASAHAAVGDDSTCKIGCWAAATPGATDADRSETASNAGSLGLVADADRQA